MSSTAFAAWPSPFARLRDLLDQAGAAGVELPEACCLATSDPQGRPSARMVLLRGLDERGLVFYTNLDSRKAQDLTSNAHASLCFHWQPLVRQVRVDGRVELVSEVEADAYWASRPRDRQLGAWASDQSKVVESREALDARWDAAVERFGEEPIPRPERWSGYRVLPDRWEFWEGRRGRMHHRERYERALDPAAAEPRWGVALLQP